MIIKQEYPILEYDDSRHVKVSAKELEKLTNLGIKYGVIDFCLESREELVKNYPSKIVGTFKGCGVAPTNVYEIDFNGTKILSHQGVIGSPLAAAVMEDLIAMGCDTIVAVGDCGVLDKTIKRADIIVPTGAVRAEGTSYHYVAPSRTIQYSPEIIQKVCDFYNSKNIPFVKGLTWTTDAIYRETEDAVKLRQQEGCICVEMENATFGAVAQHYGVKFFQILYGGDCLDTTTWDARPWCSPEERLKTKYELSKLAMEMVLKI